MKKTYFIGLFLLFVWNVSLQAQINCTQPMSNFSFSQKKKDIANQASETQKLTMSKQVLETGCFSSAQIKEIADLFADDYNRMEFAKMAYSRVFDKGNFYDVYNSFHYFSVVFMLHDYVLEQRGTIANNNPNNNPNNNNSVSTLNFPPLNYPNIYGYSGVRKCDYPMADNAFIAMAQEVAAQNSEDMKMQRMDAIINNNCLTTAQAMKLSTLLLNESNRLGFLKKAYSKTFDIGNFQQAVMVFSLIPNQNNFLSFLNANNPTNCTVSADEFKEIKNRISRESFDNTRKNTAKSILQSKKCFTTQQVKEMVAIFSFSDSKMEIAKFAYDFTTDRENYYVVADAFTFPSDKDKLLKFIESRK